MSPKSRLRVFISHSTSVADTSAAGPEDKFAAEVRDALHERLTQAGFAVWLDRAVLTPGDAWMRRITLGLEGCDAAVILLSPAALKSHYVAYEAAIISHRVALAERSGGKYFFVPILLPGVGRSDVEEGSLKPADIFGRQYVTGDTADKIVDAVVKRFEGEKPISAPTRVEARANRIRDLIQDVSERKLQRAGELLGVDLEALRGWRESWDAHLFLAVQLMSAGLVPAGKALLWLIEGMPLAEREYRKARLIALIASAFVDYDSAELIPRVAKRMDAVRALCLGVSLPDTANLYITCAKSDDPEDAWFVTQCSAVFGERASTATLSPTTTDLIKAVRAALVHVLGSSEAELDDDLVAQETYDRPVVIMLPRAGISKEVLAELKANFRAVTFLLLRGDKPQEELPLLTAEEVKFLVPAVMAEDEKRFARDYDLFKKGLKAPVQPGG